MIQPDNKVFASIDALHALMDENNALKAENERLKEKLARYRLANMKFRKFINEDLFHVLTRYLPKKKVFSEIIGLLRLKYDRIEAITEKGGEDE